MPLSPNSAALFFTVALLMVTAYFLLGSVPLLILKHDTPVDAKFIRGFYNTYYRIALVVAVGATLSYAWSGRLLFAVGAAGIVWLTWRLRREYLPRMDRLGTQIQAEGTVAIPEFRSIHKSAILITLGQLVAVVSSLGAF